MGWDSSDVVRFDIRAFLQGQTMIGPRGLESESILFEIMDPEHLIAQSLQLLTGFIELSFH